MKKKNDHAPLWLEGKTVNEVLFCQDFLAEHPMVNVGNAFFMSGQTFRKPLERCWR